MASTNISERGTTVELVEDPVEAARAAGLRYVTDRVPGVKRKRAGKGFTYTDAKGERVTDGKEVARIKALVIPPAWTDVWISPSPNGHIQATGRDEKGRKQYRYHERWREVRDENKYTRMIEFGHALPTIRERVEQDMGKHNLSKEKVLATVVRLLETTYIRVGNEEYARTNKSFGLTTMRCRHISVTASHVQFKFRGKSGKNHNIIVEDPRLARIVKRLQELPGQELFGYIDEEGRRRTINSDDVNTYLHEITGQHFTAKDFRTWGGTVLATVALEAMEQAGSATGIKKNIVAAVKEVSAKLGNTPAICRKSYIHPAVIQTYTNGTMSALLLGEEKDVIVQEEKGTGLNPEEKAVIRLLECCLEQEKR